MGSLEKVKKHFNFKIIDEWSDGLDWYFYEESTADGYVVYVSTDNVKGIHVGENIYYYDTGLATAFKEVVENNTTEMETLEIYVEDTDSFWLRSGIELLAEKKN